MTKLENELAKTINTDQIAYSMLWEDSNILIKALEINSDDNVLSITSAGCNVLSLLLQNPKSITAIDLNPAQTNLFRLKIAAIKFLTHKEFLSLFGFSKSINAIEVFTKLSPNLDEITKNYFNNNITLIKNGLIHTGKLEKYFSGFAARKAYQEIIHSIYNSNSIEEQKLLLPSLFTAEFDKIFLSYFSKENQSKSGRDSEKYKCVNEKEVALGLLKRFKQNMNQMLLKNNYFNQYFLTSNFFDLENSYPYVKESNFNLLKQKVDTINIVTEELEQHLEKRPIGFYTKGNLSDIFEYMSEDQTIKFLNHISNYFASKGRIAFWNLYNQRSSNNKISKLKTLEKISKELYNKDKVWFYTDFFVEEVK